MYINFLLDAKHCEFYIIDLDLLNSFKECCTFPGNLVVTCGLVWSFQDLLQALLW